MNWRVWSGSASLLLLLASACSDDGKCEEDGCQSAAGSHGGAGGEAPSTGGSTGGGCTEGLTACDDACVDLESDPMHCGGCDKACDPPPEHGAVECAGFIEEGSCAYSCEDGYEASQEAGDPSCVPVGG